MERVSKLSVVVASFLGTTVCMAPVLILRDKGAMSNGNHFGQATMGQSVNLHISIVGHSHMGVDR